MSKTKIFIAGHKGMVGSAIFRILKKKKNLELITKDKDELNLLNQKKVEDFFKNNKVDQVYLAAAKVGGIFSNNNYPANFIYENLMIQTNIINSAFLNGVRKLLFLGSSCIYPKKTHQPIKEKQLLTGKLEITNEPYAVAKIAGIKMCESYNRQYGISHNIDFRCIMPTNLYGPNDNYHSENSHVIPGLIRRFHEAKIKGFSEVMVWGDGSAKRDFLYVEDMARASIHLMNLSKKKYKQYTSMTCSHINVGSGLDITIKELAKDIKEIVGYKGEIKFDITKPNGTAKKLLDIERMEKTGFKTNVSLKEGLLKTYNDYLKFHANF